MARSLVPGPHMTVIVFMGHGDVKCVDEFFCLTEHLRHCLLFYPALLVDGGNVDTLPENAARGWTSWAEVHFVSSEDFRTPVCSEL